MQPIGELHFIGRLKMQPINDLFAHAHGQVVRCFVLLQRLLMHRGRIKVKRKKPVECSTEGSNSH